MQFATKCLDNLSDYSSDYLYGIDACNEVLDGKGPDIGSSLRHDCLCIRAALLLKVGLHKVVIFFFSLNLRWVVDLNDRCIWNLVRENGRMMHTWLLGTVTVLACWMLLHSEHIFIWPRLFFR